MSVRAIVLTSLVSTFSLAPPVPFPSRPEVPGTQGPNSRWRRDLRPVVSGAGRREKRLTRNTHQGPFGPKWNGWVRRGARSGPSPAGTQGLHLEEARKTGRASV